MAEPRSCPTCGASPGLPFSGGPCPVCAFSAALQGNASSQIRAEASARSFSFAPANHDESKSESGENRPPQAPDGYELMSELGRGASATVWLARDRKLDRLVALKLIFAGADRRLAQRLVREGQAAASLRHPNIVAVHALGRTETHAYLAMDFFDGGDLGAWLAQRPLPPRRAAEVVGKLAEALAHAHAGGVLHRDIKPSNVLLDAEGEPHLGDFGLAGPLEGAGDLTLPGQIAGTPSYLAPELLAGADHASPQSDVYSLGALLYECLTGQPPFIGDSTAAVLALVARADPPLPHLLQPGLPRDLEAICLKSMEKAPQRRYRSAEAFADDLLCFLDGRPISVRPLSAAGRLVRWCRRWPSAAAAAALGVTLVLVLSIGAPIFAWRIDVARRAARTALGRAEAAEAQTQARLRDALLARAHATRLTAQRGQRDEALAAIGEAARIQPGLDARNEAIAALALPEIRQIGEWKARSGYEEAIGFDLEHDRYAVETADRELEIHRLGEARGEATLRGDGGRVLVGPFFSPNGRCVVIRGDRGEAVVWFIDRAQPAFRLPGRRYILTGRVTHYGEPDAFSPDGSVLASSVPDGGVSLHALDTGAEIARFPTLLEATHVLFSPDGKFLAVGRGLHKAGVEPSLFLQVLDAKTGALRRSFPVAASFQAIAWSADSRRLAICGERLEVFDLDNLRAAPRIISTPNPGKVFFGADSDSLISCTQSGVATLWDLETARPTLTAILGSQPEIAVDRSGTLLAKTAGGNLARLFRLQASEVAHRWPRGDEAENVAAHGSTLNYSPDGRWLAVALWGEIELRSGADGRRLTACELGDVNNPSSVVFASDSRSLFVASEDLGLARVPIDDRDPRAPQLGTPSVIDPEKGFLLADVSADGREALLTSLGRGLVKVVAPETGRTLARWPVTGASRGALSPDGREAAVNRLEESNDAPDPGLSVFNARSGRPLRSLSEHSGHHVRWSRDGRWLAAGTGSDSTGLWRQTDRWRPALPLPVACQGIGCVTAFSFDSAWLAVAYENFLGLIRLEDGAEVARLPTLSTSFIPDLAFSPDGRHLSAVDEFGRLIVWDLAALRAKLKPYRLDW